MRERFAYQNFRGSSLETIERANQICADYQAQGYNLTLRQVYYQFVARDWLPNNQKNYKRLGDVINNARLAGEMDWNYIQDRTRNVAGSFAGFDSPGQFIDQVKDQYYEALWEGQNYRPEVWVEKDALVDIVGQACATTHVPYFSCRGYVSQSEMYDAAKRMQQRLNRGLTPIVIHLGDHDPSGVDMSRDIQERLSLMAYEEIEVRRIALNMDQVQQYNPPPNPTKFTDSRSAGYVQEYGYESWELDALEPSVLTSLIQDTIQPLIDPQPWLNAQVRERENADKIRTIADRWSDIEDHWDDVLDIIGS